MSLYTPGTDAFETHRLHEFGASRSGAGRGDWRDKRTRRSSLLRERATIGGAIQLTIGPHPVDFGPHGRAEIREARVNGVEKLIRTTPILRPPADFLLSMTSGEVDGWIFALAETPTESVPYCLYPLSLWIGRGEQWWAVGAHWAPEQVGMCLRRKAAAWLRSGETYEPLPDGPRRVIDEMFVPLGCDWIVMEDDA